MGKIKDLTGMTFGRLTVLGFDHKNPVDRCAYWKCQCSCQNKTIVVVKSSNLLNGNSKSCGCLQKDKMHEMRFNDLTGQMFGRLKVLHLDHIDSNKGAIWVCQCTCPNKTLLTIEAGRLKSGNTVSCGCYHDEIRRRLRNDLTGKTFGRLTVLRRVANVGSKIIYECRCSCPSHTLINVSASNLTSGHTRSCGCLNSECVKERCTKYHDEVTKHLVEVVFSGMKTRCTCETNSAYKDYGARGISICQEWLDDPIKFAEWAKTHGYRKGLEIDRINNDGPYSSWNCRFTDNKTQANNRRSNRMITVNGVSLTVAQWADIIGVNPKTLYFRTDAGIELYIKNHCGNKIP